MKLSYNDLIGLKADLRMLVAMKTDKKDLVIREIQLLVKIKDLKK